MIDEKYKVLFHNLRATDEKQAPTFERVWQGALAKVAARQHSWRVGQLALAGALVMALVGSLWFFRGRKTFAEIGMSAWQAPTTSLEKFPGNDIATFELSSSEFEKDFKRWHSPTTFLLDATLQ